MSAKLVGLVSGWGPSLAPAFLHWIKDQGDSPQWLRRIFIAPALDVIGTESLAHGIRYLANSPIALESSI
jgi:hypothetical protein